MLSIIFWIVGLPELFFTFCKKITLALIAYLLLKGGGLFVRGLTMEDKLQALTDKLYSEGLKKGEEEAKEKVAKAEEEAAAIIKKAREEAAAIIATAQKEAAELTRNNESEVKLSAQKMIAQIKEQIVNLITAKTIGSATGAALDDPAVMGELIVSAAAAFAADPTAAADLTVLLPAAKKEKLESALKVSLKKLMDGGLKLEFAEGLKGGFTIGPKNGSYQIVMSESDFKELFAAYIRPASRKLIFGE